MSEFYGDTSGVEVLRDGRRLPLDKWRRYAVRRKDLEKARLGEETRYGCDGDIVVRAAKQKTPTLAPGVSTGWDSQSCFRVGG